MPSAQNDLAAAAQTWNNEDESVESINNRIHDGVPLDQLAVRADHYVTNIIDQFPYAPLQEGSFVMEVGPGTGTIMEGVDRYAKARDINLKRIVGLDIAEHMIEKAKSHLGDRPEFSFVHYDGLDVPLPDKSFDLIYSVAALQHVPKPYVYNLLFELRRLLKDDGRLVVHLVGFKCLGSENTAWWKNEISNQVHKVEGHWHHLYTAEELQCVLAATGFKHIDIRDGRVIWFCASPESLPAPADQS